MRLSPACLLAILSLSLPAARVFAADKWVHATSAHFDMYAAESDAEVRAALQHLEAVRTFFATATHSQDPNGQPVRIVVFHSEGDFNRFKPAEYVMSSAYPLPGPPDTIVA
jgi:phosphoglycerate dehydrogenase-like enzyme